MLRPKSTPLTRATHARAFSTRRSAARRASVVRASATAKKPWEERDCRLVLEDGSVWNGRSFGAKATQVGEVVFNTSLSGYVVLFERIAKMRVEGMDRWVGRARARGADQRRFLKSFSRASRTSVERVTDADDASCVL